MAREAPHRGAATPSLDAKTERELYWDNWKEWFRRDFLRSCFVAGSLAWDGLGAIQVRYLLDPYYPGQGASGAWVYSIILGFLILSSVGQLFLYRLWWPPRETGSLPGARWTEFAWFRQRFGR